MDQVAEHGWAGGDAAAAPGNGRTALLIILLLALTVRVAYYFEFSDNPYFNFIYPSHDSMNVHLAAEDIVHGDLLLSKPGWKYPFYSYFVAAFYVLSGSAVSSVWVAQLALGTLGAVLVFLMATHVFGARTGWVAGMLFALYPQNLFYEGSMLRAALTQFLVILSCYALLRFRRHGTHRSLILAAVAVSMTVQCRANLLILVPFVLIYVCIVAGRHPTASARWRKLALFILVMAAVGAPLLARGILVEKRFIFYDPAGPSVLLAGNLVDYDGAGWHGVSPRYRQWRAAEPDRVTRDYPWVLQQIAREMITHPSEFIRLYGRKLFFFFHDVEIPDNNNFYLYQRFSILLRNPVGSFAGMTALALAGILLTLRNREACLLHLFAAATVLSVLVFYNVSRFRMPTVPFLTMFAAAGLTSLWELLQRRQLLRGTLTAVLVALVAAALRTGHVDRVRPNDLAMMADAFQRQKHYDQAIGFYREALHMEPGVRQTRLALGRAHCAKGDMAGGIDEFTRLLRDHPADGEIHLNLAMACQAVGRDSEMRRHARFAHSAGLSLPADLEAAIADTSIVRPAVDPERTPESRP